MISFGKPLRIFALARPFGSGSCFKTRNAAQAEYHRLAASVWSLGAEIPNTHMSLATAKGSMKVQQLCAAQLVAMP